MSTEQISGWANVHWAYIRWAFVHWANVHWANVLRSDMLVGEQLRPTIKTCRCRLIVCGLGIIVISLFC